MEWNDRALLLAAAAHGESRAVLSLLTETHGRHAGLWRGRSPWGSAARLPIGSVLNVRWRGRLAEHLGSFDGETERTPAPALVSDRGRLAALVSACALAETLLPEREPYPLVFGELFTLLTVLEQSDDWRRAYVRWEASLLAELGYALDLSRCAVTGATDELVYVSPRSGRAVSRAAGLPYHDRLLPLPALLIDAAAVANPDTLTQALALNAYFFERHLYRPIGRTLPQARLRLAELIARDAS